MKIAALLLGFVVLYGCVTSTLSLTKGLKPGMTQQQVQSVLGEPLSTERVAGRLVWRYELHEPWKGNVPTYLVFSPSSNTLDAWYLDRAEYERNQRMWMDVWATTYPAHEKHDVDLTIRNR